LETESAKFKPEQIVWYIARDETPYKVMVWLIKPVQDEGIKQVENWEYSVEILEGPGKGEFIVQFEDSLSATMVEVEKRLENLRWAKRMIKRNDKRREET